MAPPRPLCPAYAAPLGLCVQILQHCTEKGRDSSTFPFGRATVPNAPFGKYWGLMQMYFTHATPFWQQQGHLPLALQTSSSLTTACEPRLERRPLACWRGQTRRCGRTPAVLSSLHVCHLIYSAHQLPDLFYTSAARSILQDGTEWHRAAPLLAGGHLLLTGPSLCPVLPAGAKGRGASIQMGQVGRPSDRDAVDKGDPQVERHDRKVDALHSRPDGVARQ